MDLGFGIGEILDPFGILDFAKDQYAANRDYGHTREIMDSQNMFTEKMSSSAYQRAVLDMKQAGLNPMLAYSQGGASTPHGGAAPVFNRGNSSAGSIQSAAQVQNIRAQTELTNAQTANVKAQTGGHQATSDRLIKELAELVPVQIRTAQLEQDIRDAAAYFAQFEKNVPLTSRADAKMVEDYFRAKFRMLPVDLRSKMADLTWKRLRENASSMANEGFEGVRKFADYAGTTLGKVTNSAVDAVRRGYRGYQRAQSNARYRSKYELGR